MQCEPVSLPSGAPFTSGVLAAMPAPRWVALRAGSPAVTDTLAESGDVELVRRCQAGEAAAFAQLFQRHAGLVSGLVHRMLGPSPELEDLVQEVFLQVIRSLASFRDEARFSTWLYRVTVNVVLMHRRAAKSRPSFSEAPEGVAAIDQRPLSDDQLERRRRVVAFHRLLDRLSEKKRLVFVLHELEGLSPGEIAKIVGSPVLTVRTRLFYARRELLALLAEEPALAGLAGELAGETPSTAGAGDAGPAKEPA